MFDTFSNKLAELNRIIVLKPSYEGFRTLESGAS